MPDISEGPYHLEETLNAIKLQGPTYRIIAGDDGTLTLVASGQGPDVIQARIKAAVALALDALNGNTPAGDDSLRAALEEIAGDDVTNVKAAKDVAKKALGE
jgi:hypothetical protein